MWMSQLTSFDNCEPRALSKGTMVIVLIGSPLLCLERKMLSNAIAQQHRKIRHARIEHQKWRLSACYLPRTMIWRSGGVPGTPCTLEQAAVSVKAGIGPLGQARH